MLGAVGGLLGVAGGLTEAWLGAQVVGLGDDGTSALAVLTLRDVNLGGSVVGSRAVDGVEVSVVGLVLDFDLTSNVALIRLLVAGGGKKKCQQQQGR